MEYKMSLNSIRVDIDNEKTRQSDLAMRIGGQHGDHSGTPIVYDGIGLTTLMKVAQFHNSVILVQEV
jgi:hypothetical protein